MRRREQRGRTANAVFLLSEKLQRHVLQVPDVVILEHIPCPMILMCDVQNGKDGFSVEAITTVLDFC